jgi:hypothetical protein
MEGLKKFSIMVMLTTSTQYLLGPGLQDLHRQTLEWESTLGLWKEELGFFARLIPKYRQELRTRTQMQELNHVRFLLDYYENELIPLLETRLAAQKAQLRTLMEPRELQDESNCRRAQAALAEQFNSFEKEFASFREELFALLEKPVSREKMQKQMQMQEQMQ